MQPQSHHSEHRYLNFHQLRATTFPLVKAEAAVKRVRSNWQDKPPVFLPAQELLTLHPGFVPLHGIRHLEFDETWRDTCLLLGAPALRGPREAANAQSMASWLIQFPKETLGNAFLAQSWLFKSLAIGGE